MTSIPPSQPPPQLPPAVVARTRIQALMGELQVAQDATQRGVLRYEVGALSEHRLGDAVAARRHYEAAREQYPEFEPTLIALQRIYADADDVAALDEILAARAAAAPTPQQQAAVLCEHAALCLDRLDDGTRAEALLEQALTMDHGCQAAAVMLEDHHAALGRWSESQEMLERRAEQVVDPALRAVLLQEAAEGHLASGDPGAAADLLELARDLPAGLEATLRTLCRAARAQTDHTALAAALEARAGLAADGDASEGIRREAALWLHEAATARRAAGDLAAAAGDLARALSLWATPVLQLEYLAASADGGDSETADRVAARLLAAGGDGPEAAGLYLQRARHARAMGDAASALAALEEAWKRAPGSPVTAVALEDLLRAAGDTVGLVAYLERAAVGYAEAGDLGDAVASLRHAALIADAQLEDSAGAIAFLERAAGIGDDAGGALRQAYGIALREGELDVAGRLAARLCELAIDAAERGVLLRDRYVMMRERGSAGPALCVLLREALDSGVAEAWAPDAARIHACREGDWVLLTGAHDRLAERAPDGPAMVAHLCAAARASVRAGDQAGAITRLRAALEQAPGNAYAVALMEELLLASGEDAAAVEVLQAAALSQADAARSEHALLHAGFVAERAGDLEAAGLNYAEANDRMPSQVSPLWALMRLAERTTDVELRGRALEGLALGEAQQVGGGVHNLELGEHFAAMGQGALALEPLRAALSRAETGPDAALCLAQLPPGPLDDGARALGLDLLRMIAPASLQPVFAEMLAAVRVEVGEAEGAAELLRELGPHGDGAWVGLTVAQLARTARERALSFEALAGLSDVPAVRAELCLHALRLRLIQATGPDAEPGVAERVLTLLERIEDEAPGSLVSAMAWEESGPRVGDAASRVAALRARLSAGAADNAPALRLSLARALLLVGRPDEAMAEARARLLFDDDNLSLWEVVRVAGYESGDPQAVVEASDRLALNCGAYERAQLLHESAVLLTSALSDSEGAERQLHAALQADPSHQGAFALLHDLLLERGAADELLALIVLRLQTLLTPDERVELLYEAARLMRALNEPDDALTALDELLALQRKHAGALGLMTEIHASRGEHREAVEALRRFARADVSPHQRRLSRVGAADFLQHQLADPAGAHAELQALCDADGGDLAIRQRMIELAELAGMGATAARDCEAAAGFVNDVEGRAALWRRAAVLYSRLSRPVDEERAYRTALEASPTDVEALRGLHGLLAATCAPAEAGWLLDFERAVGTALDAAPTDVALWSRLAEVAGLRGDAALAHVAGDTLRTLDGSPPRAKAPWSLVVLSDAELGMLRAPGDEGPVTALARDVALTVAAMRRAEGAVEVGSATKRGAAAAEAREALQVLLAVLSLRLDTAWVGGDEPGRLWLLPRDDKRPSFLVGEVARPEGGSFGPMARFEIGRQAMAFRDGVWPLFAEPATRWHDLVCAATVAAEAPLPGCAERPELRELGRRLAARMPRAVRARIAQRPAEVTQEDVSAYLAAAELTQLQAGTLLAGSIQPGLTVVVGAGFEPMRVADSARAMSLLRFWRSRGLRGLVEAEGDAAGEDGR